MPKSDTEDEEVRNGRGMGGHRACEPGVFRGRGGIKLKVLFELLGIYKCRNEQNNQLTCVAINQLLCWHIDSQSA